MLLRELEAFEACWLDLKDQYPTSRDDNTLIAHAMGQIVDLVEKPDQVERNLPEHLKILFRRLAIAYFQGYIAHQAQPKPTQAVLKPLAMATPARVDTAVQTPLEPIAQPDHQQKQDISAAVEQVRQLANQAQARLRKAKVSRDCPVPNGCSIEEMETLIVDFPDHWHTNA
ncbi:hypothetical protein GFS31_05180 [Leptolyngbya sp. BL0902]|uniref:hypothetical protein n=1 Tax=Leptolyngbya sp. BL0902 TaxID=1115757 RepID=UPI0018E8CB85|nr:hypothetical protein [Leptolyngbya sp. BL0902]QQE63847.1 hypothetical protein GFS31_05180 [Leptolyngbya sp. BL0902]